MQNHGKLVGGYIAAVRESFRNTLRIYRIYWSSYGGIVAVLSSVYFIASVVLTLICSGFWTTVGWWDLPISVLPNLIGFTLAGYAILFAFSDKAFLYLLVKARPKNKESSNEAPSAFITISSTFMHFLLMEIVSLLFAIIAKSRPFSSLEGFLGGYTGFSVDFGVWRRIFTYSAWAFGFGIFIYAICLSMAATAAIFRLAGWFESRQRATTLRPDE